MSYSDSEFSPCNIHFCKPLFILAPILRVIFAIPAASSKSEQVFSVAGRVVTLDWNRLAPEMVEVQSATAEKHALCVKKPSCSAFDLTFIIQHICSYLVKPALIWKKNDKSGNHFWIWKILASGSCLGRCATIIIRDTLFDVNISAALLSPYMIYDYFLLKIRFNTLLSF